MEKFIHNKTGNEYEFVQDSKVKIDGVWIDCVIYMRISDKEIFVRPTDNFYKSFTKVENE